MSTFFERYTFLSWLSQVDAALDAIAGVTRDDLNDVDWVAEFHDEVEPEEAAQTALDDDGLLDEGWADSDEEWLDGIAEWDSDDQD